MQGHSDAGMHGCSGGREAVRQGGRKQGGREAGRKGGSVRQGCRDEGMLG